MRHMKNHFSSSVLHDGHIFGFDNATLRSISAKTGESNWAKRGFGKGSLMLADGQSVEALFLFETAVGLFALMDSGGDTGGTINDLFVWGILPAALSAWERLWFGWSDPAEIGPGGWLPIRYRQQSQRIAPFSIRAL